MGVGVKIKNVRVILTLITVYFSKWNAGKLKKKDTE